MKDFTIRLFLAFCLFFVFISGIASAEVKTKNVRGENLVIVENNKLYGLNDKLTGKEILPGIYSEIKKIKYKNETVFVGNYGFHKAFYSPDGLYDDFLKEYYSNFSGIKFKNYPKNGSVIYKNKTGNIGVITVKDGILYVTDAVFESVNFPDKNSLIAKYLNISFASPDRIFLYFNKEHCAISLKNYTEKGLTDNVINGVILVPEATVYEDISVSDNEIISEYKNINFDSDEFFAVFDRQTISKNKLNITFSPIFKQNQQRLYSTEEFYEIIENTYDIELKNYPEDFTLYAQGRAETVKDGRYTEINGRNVIPAYGDSLLNTLTGLKISFQNPDTIISKENGKYGLIDRYENVKIPFIYDRLEPLERNTSEKITYNPKTKKAILTYNGNNNDGEYFLAVKTLYDKETGMKKTAEYLINSENKILLTFDNESSDLKEGIQHATRETANITKSDIAKENRKMFFKQLPSNIAEATVNIILLPFMLIYPDFNYIFADINYF